MASSKDLDIAYITHAEQMAKLSKAKRLKVGATAVTDHGVMLSGFNGTAKGQDNVCETPENTTKPNVIHAEENCILKAAREGVSLYGSTMYITHSPCQHCAAMMINAGVKRVVFGLHYRDDSGIIDLKQAGVIVDPLYPDQR